MARVIDYHTIHMGCDPEFFFKDDNGTVGAEKVLPKNGMKATDRRQGGTGKNITPKFVIDGVQAELNPRPNFCRAYLANEISSSLKTLKAHLQSKGIKADFSSTIEISKERLMELDEKST